jgi:hypothetical protein
MPTRLFVERREDFERGKSFGAPGPYEFIAARVVSDAGEGRVEVLKPRDPAKGNGTMLFAVNSKTANRDQALLEQGHTFVSLQWKDQATMLRGVHELVAFLKLTGGPMLLGDQRRFLKRALAAHADKWLPAFKDKGLNNDEKGRTLFDGVWPDK